MLDEPSQHGGTVGKALEVLDDVAAFGRPVRFVELLGQSRYPKATLYRLLRTLSGQGMLDYDPPSQTYSLGQRLVRLAHTAWRNFSLATVARPHICDLAQHVGVTVHLAQLDNGQVLYIDKINPADPIEMFSQAGRVGPAYCTGIGKAMLAFLDPAGLERAVSLQAFHRYTEHTLPDAAALHAALDCVRADGHAYDREEHEPDIICVAAPILTGQAQVIGGLSITSSKSRNSLASLEKLLPSLKKTASDISATAEKWRFPGANDRASDEPATQEPTA